MAVECREENGVVLVSFSGDVDMASMSDLRETFFDLYNAGSDISFDMTNVSYLDSSGLGMLLLLKKKQKEKGRCFRVVNIPEPLQRLLSAGTIEALVS
ncbi:MAG: STAS domain-containing protein [Spirochaetota bacterium]